MSHTDYLRFANYSDNLHKLISGRNCSLLASGVQRRHFGVEVECCDYSRYDDSVLDSYTGREACRGLFSPFQEDFTDFFDVKEDCSLCGRSFEMVTAPMTMKLLKKLDWDKFFSTIRQENYHQTDFNDYDKAGIHVHVNRKSFDKPFEAAVNALLFISDHENVIRRFARRSPGTWDSWCSVPSWAGCGLPEAIKLAASGDYYDFGNMLARFPTQESRYRCVNFCSPNTWELRIFNSTLDSQTMYNILDFTDALWQLCDKPYYDIDLDQMHDKLLELGNPVAAELMYNPPEDVDIYDDYEEFKEDDENEVW